MIAGANSGSGPQERSVTTAVFFAWVGLLSLVATSGPPAVPAGVPAPLASSLLVILPILAGASHLRGR